MAHTARREAAGVGPRLLADQAYYELRDRIVRMGCPPGAPLREERLMSELGVGRTPLREAVKRLALEGLVEIRPSSGTYVTQIEQSDIALIAEVRAQLEPYAARLAAQRMDEQDRISAMTLKYQLTDAAAAPTDAQMGLDEDVHRLIWQAARNPYLLDSLDRLYALSLRLWYVVVDRVADHGAAVTGLQGVLGALIVGDSRGAASRMRQHVVMFEAAIAEALRQ